MRVMEKNESFFTKQLNRHHPLSLYVDPIADAEFKAMYRVPADKVKDVYGLGELEKYRTVQITVYL